MAKNMVGQVLIVLGVVLGLACATVLGDALGAGTILPLMIAVALIVGGVDMAEIR